MRAWIDADTGSRVMGLVCLQADDNSSPRAPRAAELRAAAPQGLSAGQAQSLRLLAGCLRGFRLVTPLHPPLTQCTLKHKGFSLLCPLSKALLKEGLEFAVIASDSDEQQV